MDPEGSLNAARVVAQEMRSHRLIESALVVDTVVDEARRLKREYGQLEAKYEEAVAAHWAVTTYLAEARAELEATRIALETEQENLMIWKDVIRALAKGVESWESALDLRDRILAELS